MPPWGFDVDASEEIRHMWFRLLLIADAAQAEAQQVRTTYQRNTETVADREARHADSQ